MRCVDIANELELEVLASGDEKNEITGAITGDLLSFVMGRGQAGWLWITVQTHLNVVAVAVLKDIPMVIIASGRVPASDMVDRCRKEEVFLARSERSAFDLCGELHELGLRS